MSRPFLIVALSGDDLLATAAVSSAAANVWTVTLIGSREQLQVTGEDNVRRLFDRLNTEGQLRPDPGKYERDDPETGAPLPPGVDGFHVGGRHR